MASKRKTFQAYSLIDFLVAIFILTTFISVFFTLLALKSERLSSIEKHIVAQNAIYSKIETIKTEGFACPKFPWKENFSLPDPEMKGEVRFQEVEKGLVQIYVQVVWQEKQQEVLEWACTYLFGKK